MKSTARNGVFAGPGGTVHGFSAVCWYTGKNIFEKLGGQVPVGLIVGSVGGSAIEFWLPTGHVNSSSACGADEPPCDINNNITDSDFFNRLIKPFMPYTIGSMIWDQVGGCPLSPRPPSSRPIAHLTATLAAGRTRRPLFCACHQPHRPLPLSRTGTGEELARRVRLAVRFRGRSATRLHR